MKNCRQSSISSAQPFNSGETGAYMATMQQSQMTDLSHLHYHSLVTSTSLASLQRKQRSLQVSWKVEELLNVYFIKDECAPHRKPYIYVTVYWIQRAELNATFQKSVSLKRAHFVIMHFTESFSTARHNTMVSFEDLGLLKKNRNC